MDRETAAGEARWLRSRRIAPVLVAGAAILLLSLLFTAKVARKMPDLEVYWKAAVRARAAEPLYRAEDRHYQLKYLPAFAVLTIPVGMIPLSMAKALWFTISIPLLAALVALSLALLPERRKPGWLLVGITLVVMLKFYGHEVVLGQTNALFAVIVMLGLLALVRGDREAAAGAFIALAVAVKPYAIIFLPWLIARRRVRSIAAMAIGLAAVIALPAIVYGVRGDIELHRSWWRTVIDSTAPNLTNADNVSIAALYAKWIGAGPTAAALAAATGVLLLAIVAWVFFRRRTLPHPDSLEGTLLLTSIPLLSPQGWDYVFLLSTPAIMYLANYEDRLPRPMRMLALAAMATIGLSLYDLMGRAAYAAFMALSVITICFLIVVMALCALRLRAVA